MSNELNIALTSYLKLKDKLIAVSEGRYDMPPSPLNLKAVKHHYIPKHFIDGFLNQDGVLWIYHKQKNKILRDPQGPKGVFFEAHRNSVKLDNRAPMPIFEHYYTTVDNLSPFAIKLLRSDWTVGNSLASELYEHLNIFLVDLYWRNINTDLGFDHMFESLPIYVNDKSISLTSAEILELKSTPEVKQQVRINMSHESLRTMARYMETHKLMHGMIAFDSVQLCIGDMPYIMEKQPSNHGDLISTPLAIPVSSKKLYLRNLKSPLKWNRVDRAMLNALIIDQSSRYIACADKLTLERAVQTYHIASDNSLLPLFRDMLFNRTL